jgi:hypothetical protein
MKGIVYKIQHNDSDLCYIGSSLQTLEKRWKYHRDDYQKYCKDSDLQISIHPYMKQYGIENFKIVLIKIYDVVDHIHLRAYEQLQIENHKPLCINTCSAFSIKFLSRKTTLLKYCNKNREILRLKNKEFYKKNKQAINERANTKIICECGSITQKANKAQHERSKKHKDLLDRLKKGYLESK